jgi:outer membrane receptor protein involved in Fe transport
MKNTNIISLLFVVVSATFALAQSTDGPFGAVQKTGGGMIKGLIRDKESGTSLPYTNLILYQWADSALVTGAISDDSGMFSIGDVPEGAYYLEVKYIGYKKEILTGIEIGLETKLLDLGVIQVSAMTSELGEVVVTGARPLIEYRLDKKVIKVSENLNAMGSSVAAALENIPSITVDMDGNLALRGSTNFTLLIDGKPSPLNGSDALRQIPASAVEDVEIITNPSARYDPDGLAGIINIITKKQSLNGISGIANLSAGTRDKYRGDFLLSSKAKKITAFLGADFNDEDRLGTRTRIAATSVPDTTITIASTGKGTHSHNGYTFKAGLTYNINERNTISAEGSAGERSMGETEAAQYHEFTTPPSSDLYYVINTDGSRSGNFYSFNLQYRKVFSDDKHNLVGYFYFEKNPLEGEDEYLLQYLTDENWKIDDAAPYMVHSGETSRPEESRFQIDYTVPFGAAGRLEAGYQFRFEKESEQYFFNEYDHDRGEWIDNPAFSSAMNFRQHIEAAYLMYSDEWNGFGLQGGLRGEYTYRSVANKLAEEPSVVDRFDFFPSLHLSRKVGKQDQATASYSRRINRPRGFFLDPFKSYIDPNTIRVGNPDLGAEYVDSYELSYQKGLGKSFISADAYYRLTHDKMTRVVDVQEDGIRVMSMENLDKEHAYGTEFMFNITVLPWFNFNAGVNLYRYWLQGVLYEDAVDAKSSNTDFRLTANFKLSTNTRLQLQGFYQGPSVTAQGSREQFFTSSAALRQELFGNKLAATLRFSDMFNTNRFNFTAVGPNFHDQMEFRHESQILILNLSYAINNYKRSERGERENGEGASMDNDF